jgi:hypothetical protein
MGEGRHVSIGEHAGSGEQLIGSEEAINGKR